MPKKVSKQGKKVKDIKTNNKDIFSEIAEILAKDKRFIKDDNTIDKIGFRNAISSLDEILLRKFYDNKVIKSCYFKKVGDLIVFDKTEFMYLFENVQFLGDSYTRFKSDIGLIDKNEKFIVDNDDVVLSFPFKDCVLEFDSTDANDDREEYFINERISKEKIDVMFENKVFINCKKIGKDGEKNIEKFDINDNLLIKGNNLLALHTLLPVYKESIKLMYWDILYNTENDKIPYADSFKHSSWLVMMKNRLEIAKKLIRDDGVICLQCDETEMAYLKVLCDEIFNRNNCINVISLNTSTVSGPKIAHVNSGKGFPKTKEYILIYSVNSQKVYVKVPKIPKESFSSRYDRIIPEWKKEDNIMLENGELDIDNCNEKIKDYTILTISQYAKEHNIEINDVWLQENAYRIFVVDPNKSLSDLYKNTTFDKIIKFVKTSTGLNKLIITNFNRSAKITNIELANAELKSEMYLSDNWVDKDVLTTGIHHEGGVTLEGGKKPEKLVKRLIDSFTNEKDIVLDAYFGTGTTGSVVMKMNRRFIGIEQLDEHIDKLAIPRLKNVINGDETGISKLPDVNWKGGGSFVYIELAKLNQNYIDRINNVKKSEENKLLSIYSDIKNNAYLNCYIDTNRIDSQTEKFTSLNFTDKKKFLRELLDKNQLYVNLMDIDDKEFNISDNDKKFTKSFYKKGN